MYTGTVIGTVYGMQIAMIIIIVDSFIRPPDYKITH